MNYRKYFLSFKEYLLYCFTYFAATCLISYLFYYSFYPMILFIPLIVIYLRYVKKHLKQKRDYKLTVEFNDFINILSSLLSSGYSLENAITMSLKELNSLYQKSMMIDEVENMIRKLKLHIAPEDIFKDFALRTDIKHIHMFSEILSIAKLKGGDLVHIIMSSSSTISSQIEIEREIATTLSGRKYELYVMTFMPILIMFYIKLSQPGFFNPVYGNLAGIFIMTACLTLYVSAILIAKKILTI